MESATSHCRDFHRFPFPSTALFVMIGSNMETDNNEIKQAIQTDIETGDGILSAAAAIARGGACPGADAEAGTQRRGPRVVAHEQRRQQDARLIEWARGANRLIDNDAGNYAIIDPEIHLTDPAEDSEM
jgi:hypothetical protein